MRVGIFSNLHAGRSKVQMPRLRAYLKTQPDVLHVPSEHPEAVTEILAGMAEQEIDLLLVYGGDGTLQRVLTEVLGTRVFGDRLPLIAPLRGGSTNMTALDLGAQRDPVKGVDAVLRAAEAGQLDARVRPRHVLHVASQRGDIDQYGMFFGAGTIYRAIEIVQRTFPEGPAQGVFGSTLVAGSLMVKRAFRKNNGIIVSDRFEIVLDGKPVGDEEYNLVMTSTLHRLFNQMRPFWGTEDAPVQFTAMASRAEGFGRALPHLIRGRPNGRTTPERGYTSHNTHQVELRMDCGFTIDGELHSPCEGRALRITADDQIQFVRA